MFKILSIFSIYLVALQSVALAGSAQTNNILQYSGIGTSGASALIAPVPNVANTNVVTLAGSVGSSLVVGSNYYGLYSVVGGTFYQVPSGKTFYITDIWVQGSYTGSPNYFGIGYGTAALSSEGTGTAPTGVVYMASASANITASFLQGLSANTVYHYSFPGLTFPASSYPFWRPYANGQSSSIIVSGIVQ